MVTDSLTSLLEEKGFEVVGVVSDGRALVAAATVLQPDVVVLDICMPLMNGVDAAARLKQCLPDVKIVFLTMRDDPNLVTAVLSLGPVGYVLKHSAGSELVKAIRAVDSGRSYVTATMRAGSRAAAAGGAQDSVQQLTARQREVLQLLAEGRGMKQVSGILQLSEKAVMYHKYHIMRTFKLRSNAELVLLALKENLISVDVSMSSPSVSSGA